MLIVDRFEGEYAVCELSPDTFMHLSLAKIDGDVREGDVLSYHNGRFVADVKSTAQRSNAMREKTNRLFQKTRSRHPNK
ncbi:DUF3006 domain-containing protein [Eubacteriales bacterium OttesenSCG-928-K08]|nr:DUF3006 domain-containing protein [Eubacteriales bacterium OttesenSCG-928-K08]